MPSHPPKSRLLKLFGVGRAAPVTRAQKLGRWAERVLSLAMLGLLALHTFPQVLYPHSRTYGGITLHAAEPLPDNVEAVIGKAAALLQASELADPAHRSDVYVAADRWRARVLMPWRGAFAYSVPITGNIFVAEADITNNRARSAEAAAGPRTISAVIAHEITHELIRKRLGLWATLRLPGWIEEGYCDYVAAESSFPEQAGRDLLKSGRTDPSHSFDYFVYRIMVRHLLDQRGLGFEQLLEHAGYEAEIRAQAIAALQ